MSLNHKRIAYDLFLLLSLLLLPWWVSSLLLLLGLCLFSSWYECLIGALILDTLFNPSDGSFLHSFFFTLSASGLFLLSWYLRERVLLSRSW